MASDFPYIRVAARGIIIREEKLLVQYYQDRQDLWCTIPGGGIQKGESLEKGLQREIFEELGIDVQVGALRYVRELRGASQKRLFGGLSKDFHQLELFFEILSFKGEPSRGLKTDNFATEHGWLSLSKLCEYPFYPPRLRQQLFQDWKEDFPRGAEYLQDGI